MVAPSAAAAVDIAVAVVVAVVVVDVITVVAVFENSSEKHRHFGPLPTTFFAPLHQPRNRIHVDCLDCVDYFVGEH